jgi:hypothetical protein
LESARILRMNRATLYECFRAGEVKAQKDGCGGTSQPWSCSGTSWRRIVPSTVPASSGRLLCLAVDGKARRKCQAAMLDRCGSEWRGQDNVRAGMTFACSTSSNADLIAGGLSPLKPELAAIAAGRLVLKEIARFVEARSDFAFESTLSGLGYVSRLRDMRQRGYHIEIIYLKIVSSRLAVDRIKSRVAGMTYPERMCVDALPAVGRTLRTTIAPWLTHGRSTTIRIDLRC